FTDYSRPAVQSYRGAMRFFRLSRNLTDGLKALSRCEGVTFYMTLLAAFQVLLQRYTGKTDIAVGANVAGRDRIEMEGLIGFCANTVVLRTSLSGNPTFRELLGRVRDVIVSAYDHQELPFEKLVEELHPERTLSHHPLFQVACVMHNSAPVLELAGLTLTPREAINDTAKFDLTLGFRMTPNREE